jgi:hypothetical protein
MILIIGKSGFYSLCLFDTIQSKYIPSAIKNTIDKELKIIDGKVV